MSDDRNQVNENSRRISRLEHRVDIIAENLRQMLSELREQQEEASSPETG